MEDFARDLLSWSWRFERIDFGLISAKRKEGPGLYTFVVLFRVDWDEAMTELGITG